MKKIKVMCTYCGKFELVDKSVADKLDETTAYCCKVCARGDIAKALKERRR